ncbi:MAG: hypothetical protein ACR2QM_14725 [Longimicrobiales bacterium]
MAELYLMTGFPVYSKSQGRKFGVTLGIAFGVLSAIILWRGEASVAKVIGSVAAALLLLGLVWPTSLRLVEKGWMKFAELLSKVTTPIFMGIIYFSLFTFVGFFRRNWGGALKHDQGATAWAAHEGPTDLRRQF